MVSNLELRIPPLVLMILVALTMWLAAASVPVVIVTFAGQMAVALILAIVGVQLAISATRTFYDRKTTVNPLTPDESSSLITDGVFKLSRNPIYLGMTLILAGLAVWLGALTSLLGVPLFVIYMTRLQIIPEERSLQAQFGQAFSAYCQRTRRWI